MTKIQQNQINFICRELGYNVAVLYVKDSKEYILYSFFESSVSNNTASIDFCTFSGLNITDLIETCGIDPTNDKGRFSALFKTFIESAQELNIKVNKIIPYILYTS